MAAVAAQQMLVMLAVMEQLAEMVFIQQVVEAQVDVATVLQMV